jgi:hypothetical protein
MVGYNNLVLLVVTSLAGPVLTELFTPGRITEEARTKKATPEGLFGRMRLDDCVKLSKRRLFGAVALRKQCLGTFRRIESFSDRFKA